MSSLTSVSVAFRSNINGIEHVGVHPTNDPNEEQLELMSRLETTNGIDVIQAIKLSEQTLINGDTLYGVRIDYLDYLPTKWALYHMGDTGNQLLKEGDY